MQNILDLDFPQYFRNYQNEIYRIVEGQHFIATRKLVDSDDEHSILEEIIDRSKPPTKTFNTKGELHYLLYTPFRYPPLKSGGRFHKRFEQSIFYGSEDLKTAMAEITHRRFIFMNQSEAVFKSMHVPHTHFIISVKSLKAILLTEPPFTTYKDQISNPKSYAESQKLGTAMRTGKAEVFNFSSARQLNGINVGLFSSEAFMKNRPLSETHWSVFISAHTVEFKRTCLELEKTETHVFNIQDFYNVDKFSAV